MRACFAVLLLMAVARAQERVPTSVQAAYAGRPPERTLKSQTGLLRWEALLGDARLRQAAYISTVAFAKDGKWIVSGGWGGKIKLWDTRTGRKIRVVQAHSATVRSLAASPDGGLLASAGGDNRVRLWDSSTGKMLAELDAKGGAAVAFRGDGRQLLYSDGIDLQLWNVEERRAQWTLRGHTEAVAEAVFSADGTRIVSVGGDKEIRVWDTVGQTLRVIEAPYDVTAIAVTPDSKSIVATCMSVVVVWNLKTGARERALPGVKVMASHVAISPDGKSVASGGLDDEIVVHSLENGKRLWQGKGHHGSVNALAYSPNGRLLVSGSMDMSVRLWKADTGKPVRPPRGHVEGVDALAFNGKGDRLATGSTDGTLTIWNTATRKAVRTVLAHKFPVRDIVWMQDRFLTVGHDWVPTLWTTHAVGTRAYKGKWDGGIFGVAADPEGKWFVTGHERGLIRKWNAETGATTAERRTHRSGIQCVAMPGDASWVVTGDFDGNVFVHDTATLRRVRELAGHTNTVRAVAVRPDGKRIATASSDGTVRIWNAATGKHEHTLEHKGPVNAVAYSPDGRWIYSARYDGALFLWDTRPLRYVDYIHVDGGPSCIAVREDRIWVGCLSSTVCVYRHSPQ